MFAKILKTRLYHFTVIPLALSVVACGGGSSSDNNTVTAPTTPIVITSANSNAVAKNTINANQAIADSSNGSFTTTAITANSAASQANRSLSGTATQMVIQAMRQNQTTTIAPAAAIGNRTCDNADGSMSGSAQQGAGTFTFKNCKLGTDTINGSVTVAGTGDLTNSFSGTFSFNNLTILDTTSGDTAAINGGFSISFSAPSANSQKGKFNGTMLSFRIAKDAIDLTNFDIQYSSNSTIVTNDIKYTLNSTFINGSISVLSTQQIQTYTANSYPFAGQLIITGATSTNGPSKVRVTVMQGGTGIASDMVQVETDADGDGSYEASQTLSWAQLNK